MYPEQSSLTILNKVQAEYGRMQAMMMQVVGSLHQRAQHLQADIQGIMTARSTILHRCIPAALSNVSN